MFAMPKLLRRHAASCHVVDIIVALFFAFTALHVHVVVPIAIVEARRTTPLRATLKGNLQSGSSNSISVRGSRISGDGPSAPAQPFALSSIKFKSTSLFANATQSNINYVLTLDDNQLACDFTSAANLTSCSSTDGGWTTLMKQTNGSYTRQFGYLPEGDDATPPQDLSGVDACAAVCSKLPNCAALCFRTPIFAASTIQYGTTSHASPAAQAALQQTNVTCYFKTDASKFVPTPPNGNCPSPGAPASAAKPTCNPLPGEMSLGGYYGHYQGHFLSATAMLYNATGNTDVQAKANRLIAAFDACMSAWATRYPSERGYLFPYDIVAWKYLNGTLPYPKMAVYSVPFYTTHKLLAGLLDQHNLAHHPKALEMALSLAHWSYRYALNALQIGGQALWQNVLNTEWGGMNEVLYNLYVAAPGADDDEANDWLITAARLFDHFSWSQPLASGVDDLAYNHANTHIPEVIGNAAGFEVTGNDTDRRIARFFLDVLRANHSFATGGSNAAEHWGPADATADQLLGSNGAATEESCTQYNVLKLARRMWRWDPLAQADLMDFYELAFFNGIVGNQDRTWVSPTTGKPMTRYIYMNPLGGSNLQKAWGASDYGFVCCWASLTESFSKLGDTLFFHRAGEDDGVPELFWNPYASATVNWPTEGGSFSASATEPYPAPSGVTASAKLSLPGILRLRIHVRIPSWADDTGRNRLLVSGHVQPPPTPGEFATIDRVWEDGDTIQLSLPPHFVAVSVEDSRPDVHANYRAFRYGPLVLAKLGTGGDQIDPLGDAAKPDEWMTVTSVPGEPLMVSAKQAGGKPDVRFIPLMDVIDENYEVYLWTNATTATN